MSLRWAQPFQREFTCTSTGPRVRFGSPAQRAVVEELEMRGASKALFLSTAGHADVCLSFAEAAGSLSAGSFHGARMHTPVAVTDEAVAIARARGADCLVALGGGSAIGLGKAIALRTALPQIAVPTTYAGSEATPILGETRDGRKTTLVDRRVLPAVIVYDPALVVDLPVSLSVASGLNAMAHAVEALYARDRNPVSTLFALEGFAALASALPDVAADPGDLEPRGISLYGAWMCGTVLGQVGMALHHKLCHTLGGSFDMPHAQTHAVLLPHTVAYNEHAVPHLLAPLRAMLGGASVAQGLFDFAQRIGAPGSLAAIGFDEGRLDDAALMATQNAYWNPRAIDAAGIRRLLEAACHGRPPAT